MKPNTNCSHEKLSKDIDLLGNASKVTRLCNMTVFNYNFP